MRTKSTSVRILPLPRLLANRCPPVVPCLLRRLVAFGRRRGILVDPSELSKDAVTEELQSREEPGVVLRGRRAAAAVVWLVQASGEESGGR